MTLSNICLCQQYVSNITHVLKGSLIASFPMTNRKWVTLHILWNTVSVLFIWPTASKWHFTIHERQSHHILSYGLQEVGDISHLWKAFSLHHLLWPTASEWHCTFCERQAHYICSYDQQEAVSHTVHFMKAVSLHLFLWPTASEWCCTFCNGALIALFLMTNSLWVILHISWRAVSFCLFIWLTGSEWHYTYGVITSFLMINSLWVTFNIL